MSDRTLQPVVRPAMIYVADFGLDSENVKDDGGILKNGPIRERLSQRTGPLGSDQSPGATAARLVDTLSTNLVKELAAQSLPAMRLTPGAPLPARGWLIQGQFLEVDKGNRLQRAVIGFGSGASVMEIEVRVSELGAHSDEPFLIVGTRAESGKAPGAVVTMNPYVAAAKFVLSKNASEKDAKNSASRIASEINGYMKAHGL
jgi:hypothetical protein